MSSIGRGGNRGADRLQAAQCSSSEETPEQLPAPNHVSHVIQDILDEERCFLELERFRYAFRAVDSVQSMHTAYQELASTLALFDAQGDDSRLPFLFPPHHHRGSDCQEERHMEEEERALIWLRHHSELSMLHIHAERRISGFDAFPLYRRTNTFVWESPRFPEYRTLLAQPDVGVVDLTMKWLREAEQNLERSRDYPATYFATTWREFSLLYFDVCKAMRSEWMETKEVDWREKYVQ